MAAKVIATGGLRLAVEGCGHGTLNAIYSSIQKTCQVNGWDGVDLLVIGGDFQAVRNPRDLNCMAVPPKYREIGDFYEYYSGVRKAPYLTLFVGGNHEASNHLFELYYGGWVAPNIYYLGAANVVRLGPLRIAGMSGIWKGYNYNKSHFERLPYSQDDIRSIYHVRELDTRKLLQIRSQIDIGISHDWPRAVEWHGDYKTLFRKKNDFEAESRAGTLGNVAAKRVLDRLKPAYWFSAHLHVKFSALVDHEKADGQKANPSADHSGVTEAMAHSVGGEPGQGNMGQPVRNEDEIDLDMDDLDDAPAPTSAHQPLGPASQPEEQSTVPQSIRDQLPKSFSQSHPDTQANDEKALPIDITNNVTHFLALDKCLPGRKFLQLLNVEPVSKQSTDTYPRTEQGSLRLEYDKEWLAITRVFASELVLGDRDAALPPNKGESYYRPLIEKEEQWIEENVVSKHGLVIPENFEPTAPIYDPSSASSDQESSSSNAQPQEYNNPQTARFCELVGIENKFFMTEEEKDKRMKLAPMEQFESAGRGRGRGRGRGWGRGRGGGGRGPQRGYHGRGRGRDGGRGQSWS